MAGNNVQQSIVSSLFSFARDIMETHKVFPYVSFVIKEDVVIARGYNREKETFDLTNQDEVVSIRRAQEALDTGDLRGYSLFSFFEPTILGFDVALWSGITDFHWCINAKSYLSSYNPLNYTIVDYVKAHPDKISIEPGIKEIEALQLVKMAEKRNYDI